MRGEKTPSKVEETKAVESTAAETKEAVKTEDTKAARAKSVKAAKETVVEETKKAAAETKEAAVKAKEAIKEKKAVKPTTKKAAREEVTPDIFIQFQNQESTVNDVIEKIKKQYVSEGHRASFIKSLQVYMKPEEFAAYYVINQKVAGKVDLF